jgi:hypothetical protein
LSIPANFGQFQTKPEKFERRKYLLNQQVVESLHGTKNAFYPLKEAPFDF